MDKTPERRKRPALKERTPTGAWRERFRQGCLDRLKNKRQGLVNNLRQAGEERCDSSQSSQEFVNQLMTDEWEKMKLESPILRNLPQCSCKRDNFEFDDDGEIDEILNVFEDIQKELMREEQRLLAQYEDLVTFDEERLCAAIDLLSTDSVTCPICKKNNLLQNNRIIFCSCGVRIDIEVDAIDLKYVSIQLKDAITSHSEICSIEPEFEVIDLTGADMKNLIMTCQSCDNMTIII